jgi:hypothetical protein
MYTQEEIETFEGIVEKKKKMPKEYWTKERTLKVFKWLIEEKMGWSRQDMLRKFSVDKIKKAHLIAPFTAWLNSDLRTLITELYPDTYKSWEIGKFPNKQWTRELAIEAIRWTFEKRLRCISDDDFISNASVKVFYDFKLRELLEKRFDDSVYAAMNMAYPGRFKREQFKS